MTSLQRHNHRLRTCLAIAAAAFAFAMPGAGDSGAALAQGARVSDHDPKRIACDSKWRTERLRDPARHPPIFLENLYQVFLQECMKGNVRLASDPASVDGSQGKSATKAEDQRAAPLDKAILPANAPGLSRLEVTLQRQHGTYLVPIEINGSMTLRFVIDSGAAFVTLPADVFAKLKQDGTIRDDDLLGKVRARLADGSVREQMSFTIRSLQVGNTVVEDVKGVIVPEGSPLLLGQTFFERFKSWSIDNAKGKLVLDLVPLTQQKIGSCVGESVTPDLQVKGCTAAIQSGNLSANALAEAYHNRGLAHAKQGDIKDAIADFDEAIRLNPQFAQSYNDRGFIYTRQGNFDRAIADYNEAIRLDPRYSLALRNRGLLYLLKREYDPAITDYDVAIQVDPKDVAAYNDRGIVYLAKRDLDRAIADFDKAIQLNPGDAQPYSNRCAAYYGKSDFDRAILDCNEAIRLRLNYVEAYANRARAYLAKGDYDRAFADYDQAIRLNPKNAGAYVNRGTAYEAKGDYDRAIADYDEAIRLNPNYAAAYIARGSAYHFRGNYDRAFAEYDQAIRLDPKSAGAYINRGNTYKAKGNFDRAIADYNEAITLNPKNAVAYLSRGNAYVDKGDYDRAIADYNEAITLNPKSAIAYDSRGNTYKAKGDYDHAITDYNEAITLNPKYAFAYFNRAIANVYAGALPKALADLNQASALDPKYSYIALWLDIVDRRSNLPSRLAQAASQLDMAKWPAPVIRLYLGEMSPEAVLAAADDPAPTTKEGQVCEANFYAGELALQQGGKDEAARLFRLAAAGCPKGFIEFAAANAELKTLGANP